MLPVSDGRLDCHRHRCERRSEAEFPLNLDTRIADTVSQVWRPAPYTCIGQLSPHILCRSLGVASGNEAGEIFPRVGRFLGRLTAFFFLSFFFSCRKKKRTSQKTEENAQPSADDTASFGPAACSQIGCIILNCAQD